MERVVLLFCLFAFVSAGEDHMETAFAVTRCRASCLDQHSHLIRTVDNCQKDADCTMCWDTCDLLNQNFKIWGPMCSVPDICFPGCQTACKSLSNTNSKPNGTQLPSMAVKSVFDFSTLRVMIEWISDEPENTEGSVLYTVLLRNRDEEVWHQVVQTTSHVVHLHNKMVFRDTGIRVLAANATDKLFLTDTTYAESLSGPKSPVYMSENGWTPQLVSMERSETSSGMLATITWSKIPSEFGPNEYEVSWNVVDNSMEITGHLMTTKNIAVLTLWPESIYLIQVNRYTSSGVIYGDTSEVLVIDTKIPNVPTSVKSTTESCKFGKNMFLNSLAVYCLIFLAVTMLIGIFIYFTITCGTNHFHSKSNTNVLKEKVKKLYRQQLKPMVLSKDTLKAENNLKTTAEPDVCHAV